MLKNRKVAFTLLAQNIIQIQLYQQS